jgi:hypothetical protein
MIGTGGGRGVCRPSPQNPAWRSVCPPALPYPPYGEKQVYHSKRRNGNQCTKQRDKCPIRAESLSNSSGKGVQNKTVGVSKINVIFTLEDAQKNLYEDGDLYPVSLGDSLINLFEEDMVKYML